MLSEAIRHNEIDQKRDLDEKDFENQVIQKEAKLKNHSDEAAMAEAQNHQVPSDSMSIGKLSTRFLLLSHRHLLLVAALFSAITVASGFLAHTHLFGNENADTSDETLLNLNPDFAAKWQTPGTGILELTILNALDDEWLPYFEKAVSDWDHGSPDALMLTTEKVPVDPECAPEYGVLKVCNGDYGDTGWRGINTVTLENNYITSSIARMNDFYFQSEAGDEYMQFTMCHEIGHGFGLNHTDEDFHNANLGNCMDYTDRPDSNELPGETNYQVLAKLYGTGNSPSASAQVAQFENRGLEGNYARGLPSWVLGKIADIEASLFCQSCDRYSGARQLLLGQATETLQYDIGSGYTIRLQLLR